MLGLSFSDGELHVLLGSLDEFRLESDDREMQTLTDEKVKERLRTMSVDTEGLGKAAVIEVSIDASSCCGMHT